MYEDLRQQIERIEPLDDREAASIAGTLDRLTWPGDVFSIEENAHHVTSSAFVVSSRGVVLHRHRRLGIWVQPGGHVDLGESPQLAAVRETLEETGLHGRHLEPIEVFHVDVHPGPMGHTHYDLRYVLISAPDDPVPSRDESPEVFWFDFPDALERCEPALISALTKLAEAAPAWNMRDLGL